MSLLWCTHVCAYVGALGLNGKIADLEDLELWSKLSYDVGQIPSLFVLVCKGYLTKYHRLGDLHNRNLFSHHSGGWMSKIKMWVELVSSEASSLACWHPHSCGLFCACNSWCLYVLISFLIKTPVRLSQDPPQWPHFSLMALLKALPPNATTFWGIEI